MLSMQLSTSVLTQIMKLDDDLFDTNQLFMFTVTLLFLKEKLQIQKTLKSLHNVNFSCRQRLGFTSKITKKLIGPQSTTSSQISQSAISTDSTTKDLFNPI